MSNEINIEKAVEECFGGPSADAILGAGEGELLAAWGYLAALAEGYETRPPRSDDAEIFLAAVKAEAKWRAE